MQVHGPAETEALIAPLVEARGGQYFTMGPGFSRFVVVLNGIGYGVEKSYFFLFIIFLSIFFFSLPNKAMENAVDIVPYFTINEGKLDEMKGFSSFFFFFFLFFFLPSFSPLPLQLYGPNSSLSQNQRKEIFTMVFPQREILPGVLRLILMLKVCLSIWDMLERFICFYSFFVFLSIFWRAFFSFAIFFFSPPKKIAFGTRRKNFHLGLGNPWPRGRN